MNICRNPEKLWNSTFIHNERELHQLVFDPNGNFVEIQAVDSDYPALHCFTGEPELENLMANGKRITQYVMDHQPPLLGVFKIEFFHPFSPQISLRSQATALCVLCRSTKI
jgi:hypothetical protein